MTNLLPSSLAAGCNKCMLQNSHLARVSKVLAVTEHTERTPLPRDTYCQR
jgi:hypothetical protein